MTYLSINILFWAIRVMAGIRENNEGSEIQLITKTPRVVLRSEILKKRTVNIYDKNSSGESIEHLLII